MSSLLVCATHSRLCECFIMWQWSVRTFSVRYSDCCCFHLGEIKNWKTARSRREHRRCTIVPAAIRQRESPWVASLWWVCARPGKTGAGQTSGASKCYVCRCDSARKRLLTAGNGVVMTRKKKKLGGGCAESSPSFRWLRFLLPALLLFVYITACVAHVVFFCFALVQCVSEPITVLRHHSRWQPEHHSRRLNSCSRCHPGKWGLSRYFSLSFLHCITTRRVTLKLHGCHRTWVELSQHMFILW